MGKRTAYDPYEQFMLRAPQLPVDILKTIPVLQGELLPFLTSLWQDPIIREGVMLGSYDFSQIIDQELVIKKKSSPEPEVLYALLRYICRFSSRCTPFGTFAGFSMGKIGMATAVRLGKNADHKLHARPDMEYLMGIARLLEADSSVREKLLFTPNTTLYRVGLCWHYVEVKIPTVRASKIYDIVTIDDSGVIEGVLDYCKGGKHLDDIRSFLMTSERTESEINSFVESLVDSKVLVSVLEPVICGPEYIDYLIAQLGSGHVENDIVRSLVQLKKLFDSMNQPSFVLSHLPLVEPIIAAISLPVNRNHLIQVDMNICHSSMMVGTPVTGQVLLGLRIIKALTANSHFDVLKGFRDAFIKRYGDRKVLLVKALDPETGIGMEGLVEGYWTDPMPWIDDLKWGPTFSSGTAGGDSGNSWLVGKFYDAIRNGQHYLNLETADLQLIGLHNGDWPNQMTAMVELFETETPDEAGIHFLLGGSGNPAYLLGRFGFADPDSTQKWISQLIDDERNAFPDTVFAEIVHLPEDRTGNVLQRPAFLEFEIPYLAQSAKPAEYQIPVTDLLIAVEKHRLVLYSSISGKKIRPYTTNAYNHQLGNLTVYKFLNRFRLQDSDRVFSPDWGNIVNQAPFIPGIRYKNMILSHPVWQIRCEDISKWFHSSKSELDLPEILAWKNSKKMPDEMLWMSHDQELFFNWTNPNLLLSLWDTVSKFNFIRVRPFYLSAGTPVKSQDGSHANQFVFCFRKT